MKARPILFSGAMVRALLAGTKTQTRRIVKLPTKTHSGGPIYERPDMGGWEITTHGGDGCFTIGKDGQRLAAPEEAALWHRTTGVCIGAPYGVPGDLLIVRETWGINHYKYCRPNPIPKAWPADVEDHQIVYFATEDDCEILGEMPKAPAIHMPRWASRLTLEITDVRVKRLQDISEADAIAEGIYRVDPDADDLASGCTPDDFVYMAPGTRQGWGMTKEERAREQWGPDPVFAYRCLWEAINGPGSWSSNPWVWAVSFKVHQQNVDALLRGMAA